METQDREDELMRSLNPLLHNAVPICRLDLELCPHADKWPQVAQGPCCSGARVKGNWHSADFQEVLSAFLSRLLPGWTHRWPCSSSQVYKLLYASRLADYGLASQALHYCEAIGAAVLSEGGSSHPVLLAELIKVSVSKRSL